MRDPEPCRMKRTEELMRLISNKAREHLKLSAVH